jgi:hypothetical protein
MLASSLQQTAGLTHDFSALAMVDANHRWKRIGLPRMSRLNVKDAPAAQRDQMTSQSFSAN